MDPRIIPITVPLGQLLHPVRLTGALMQGERNAHRFVISACAAADDPTPVPLSGTVTARFMPAGGPTVNLTGAVAGGAAVVTLAPACYSLPGPFRLSIMVTNGDDTLAACAVTGDILRTTSGVETAGSAMPGYEQVLAVYDDMQAAITRAEAALASVCPAVSAGPASLISVPDAVAIAPDALTLALPITQDLHGYDAPWPGGAAPGILYGKEVSLTGPEITLPLTLASGTYTLWAQVISTNPDPTYEIKAYPSVATGTYQEIDLYTGSSAPSAGCGVSTGAVDGIVLEGGITGHEYPPTVRVMVLSGDVALANIPPWENVCPITGRTSASVQHGATADDPDAQTYAFSFPAAAGTVYAGTLDVLTGVLTVTHAAFVVDGSTVAYTYVVTSSGRGQFRVQSAVFKQAVQGAAVAVSNWLPTTLIRINSGTGFLYGYATGTASDTNDFEDMLGITSAEQLNAMCAETPLTVVYPLKTPVPYQLTPAQVTMLAGANAIWTDDGALSLTYRVSAYDALLALIRQYHPVTTNEEG